MDASDQAEIARLRNEIAQLQEQLKARQAPTSSTSSLINDHGFVADMARFADQILSEAEIRKKYYLSNEDWERAGSDDALVRAIYDERTRRLRSGATKRERAQMEVVDAPPILAKILKDPAANERHRIDAAKALDVFAGGQEPAQMTSERFVININLGNNEVIRVSKQIQAGVDDDGNVIKQEALPMLEDSDDNVV
jgi:hypothetical protein